MKKRNDEQAIVACSRISESSSYQHVVAGRLNEALPNQYELEHHQDYEDDNEYDNPNVNDSLRAGLHLVWFLIFFIEATQINSLVSLFIFEQLHTNIESFDHAFEFRN